jgi:hypothetical protein
MQYKNLQPSVLLDPMRFQAPPEFTVTQRAAALKPAPSGQFQNPDLFGLSKSSQTPRPGCLC